MLNDIEGAADGSRIFKTELTTVTIVNGFATLMKDMATSRVSEKADITGEHIVQEKE